MVKTRQCTVCDGELFRVEALRYTNSPPVAADDQIMSKNVWHSDPLKSTAV